MQKTISPYAAGLLRKDMGDNAFNTWIQKNGISPMQDQPMGFASLLTPDQQAMGEQPLQSAPGGPSASALASLLPSLPEQKQPGRGRANDILGSIFDAIGAIGGGEPNYWGNVLQQQQEDQKGRQALAQRQADREQSFADWIWKQQYEQAHPSPTGMENDLAAWMRMTPEQRATYAQMQDVRNPIAVSGPTGTFRVPRTYGQGGGVQTQTIGGKTYYNVNGEWYDNPEGR